MDKITSLIQPIQWPFKVGILLSGIKFPLLGAILVIMDGIFHFTSPLEQLVRESPDWIIARNVFGMDALSEQLHKIMGVSLIALSLITIIGIKNNITSFYLQYAQPFVLIIIAIAILLKNIVLASSNTGKVAFL